MFSGGKTTCNCAIEGAPKIMRLRSFLVVLIVTAIVADKPATTNEPNLVAGSKADSQADLSSIAVVPASPIAVLSASDICQVWLQCVVFSRCFVQSFVDFPPSLTPAHPEPIALHTSLPRWRPLGFTSVQCRAQALLRLVRLVKIV